MLLCCVLHKREFLWGLTDLSCWTKDCLESTLHFDSHYFLLGLFCIFCSWKRTSSSILLLNAEASRKHANNILHNIADHLQVFNFFQILVASAVLNSLMFSNTVFRLPPVQGEDFTCLTLPSSSMKDCIRDRIRVKSNLLVSILIATKPSEAASVTWASSHLAAISVDCSSSPANTTYMKLNKRPPLTSALLQLLEIVDERDSLHYFQIS